MPATAGLLDGRGAAVTFEQRFGSTLNANLRFHALVLDGAHENEQAVVHAEPPPSNRGRTVRRVPAA